MGDDQMKTHYDFIVIGAGVIGSALAWKLSKLYPSNRILLVEQMSAPAMHTSGRNSGVLHPGYHLKPGTLKAHLCTKGNQLMREFCGNYGILHKQVGALVIALDGSEEAHLKTIYEMGLQNDVPSLRLLDRSELKQKEPDANGISAIFAPTGTVVDSAAIVRKLCELSTANGVTVRYNEKVYNVNESGGKVHIASTNLQLTCNKLFNCGGLWADRISHLVGVGREYRIFPFRGEYYVLRRGQRMNHMVYPVPNPEFPYLGIHFTPTVDEKVILGPNIVLSLGRASYGLLDVNMFDLYEMIGSRHFTRLMRNKRYSKYILEFALTSISKKRFAEQASRLIPVDPESLERGRPPGNRAQLVDRNGCLVDDMIVLTTGKTVHVLNAVSPGFTCSLAFAEYLIEKYTS
ncbi:MAG: L-2-hydroxyglutarate oxidase [Planctomycetes bacterium]|nr:L-2-hydroxyglutarate oxidase [Planctomycetota bacterium]